MSPLWNSEYYKIVRAQIRDLIHTICAQGLSAMEIAEVVEVMYNMPNKTDVWTDRHNQIKKLLTDEISQMRRCGFSPIIIDEIIMEMYKIE